jgi:hypothetical protein
MRNKQGKKRGALTVEQCVEKATQLIEEHGVCLFLIDGKKFSSKRVEGTPDPFEAYLEFIKAVNLTFDGEFPVNQLAVTGRTEKGFQYGLGDAAWAGITDPATIVRIVEFKEEHYPSVELHYGVAADGWSDGIELIK